MQLYEELFDATAEIEKNNSISLDKAYTLLMRAAVTLRSKEQALAVLQDKYNRLTEDKDY
jgi:hypothetical protein